MSQITKTWYLVQCKPREAFRAQEHLTNQQLECFLPTYAVKRKRRNTDKWVAEPLFPHYLFIHLSRECSWGTIRSTRGVSRIVDFNGRPAAVPDYIIQGLQIHCADMAGVELTPRYREGEKVSITEGCFREIEAVVKTTKGDERVILLLNMLNRQTQIEVPVGAITPRT